MQALLFVNNVNDAHHETLRFMLPGAVTQGQGLDAAWYSWHLPVLHIQATGAVRSCCLLGALEKSHTTLRHWPKHYPGVQGVLLSSE